MKNTEKPIYHANYDGMMSCVNEIKPEDNEYKWTEVDGSEYFYSRPKALRVLKARLRENIRDLQRCLKRLN